MSRRAPGESGRLPFYLVPIVIGMCGILFSHQIDDPRLRIAVVLVSVAAPLFAGGNLLARLYSQGVERFMVMAGLALLFIGALSTASGFTDDLTKFEEVPKAAASASRYLGLASLFTGLIALLVMLVRREEAIGEIGDRFGHLAENMNDGLVLLSPSGTVVLVNQCFLDMMGLNEFEVLGHNAAEIGPKVGILDSSALFTNADDQKHVEFTNKVNSEQRYFWLSMSTVRTRRGHRAGTLATVRDMTEQTMLAQRLEKFAQGLQKLVEDRTQQLRESEGRLRELLLHMNEGFLAVDEESRIVFSNEKVAEMLGRSQQELNGLSLYDCIDPSERTRLYESFERADDDSGEGVSRELTLVGADGSTYTAVVAISRLADRGEKSARYSLVLTDVSRLKEMQQQLQTRAEDLERANEELRMLDRAKDTFLSNVTHELRTPLSTIRGYIEMLQSSQLGELPQPTTNALQVMNRNADRLGTLIDEMIEFSRMEIRGIRLVLGLFDLEKLLQECAASARPQLEARSMTIDVSIDGQSRLIWCDRKRIGQVLTILLANAIKFSPDSAQVTLRAYLKSNRDIAIEVTDHGIGIDPKFHRRIFDKFFQVDSAMTRRYEGAGIGLSVAKSITEAHGGRIEVESENGDGSTFRVHLPEAAFIGDEPRPGDGNFPDILVCDDDAEFLGAVEGVLHDAGVVVQSVRSGYECIRRSKDLAGGMLVLGMSTQDLSVVEVLARIADGRPDGLRIVHCVASGIADTEQRISAGETAILPVPFSAAELLDAVINAQRETPEPTADSVTTESAVITMAPRVAVVDRDVEFCGWVRGGLARHHIVCACGEAGQNAVQDHWRDLEAVFIDIDNDSGDNAASLVRRRNGEGPLIVGLTCNDAATDGGLDGILRKPFKLTELMDFLGRRVQEPTNEVVSKG